MNEITQKSTEQNRTNGTHQVQPARMSRRPIAGMACSGACRAALGVIQGGLKRAAAGPSALLRLQVRKLHAAAHCRLHTEIPVNFSHHCCSWCCAVPVCREGLREVVLCPKQGWRAAVTAALGCARPAGHGGAPQVHPAAWSVSWSRACADSHRTLCFRCSGCAHCYPVLPGVACSWQMHGVNVMAMPHKADLVLDWTSQADFGFVSSPAMLRCLT